MQSLLVRVLYLNLILVVAVIGGRAFGQWQSALDSGSGFYCGARCWRGITIEQTSVVEARQIIRATYSQPDYQVYQDRYASNDIVVMQAIQPQIASPILGVTTQGGIVDAMQFYFSDHAETDKIQRLGELIQQFGPPTCVQPAYDDKMVFFIYANPGGTTQIMLQTQVHPLALESPVRYLGLFRQRSPSVNCYNSYYRLWTGLSERKYRPQF